MSKKPKHPKPHQDKPHQDQPHAIKPHQDQPHAPEPSLDMLASERLAAMAEFPEDFTDCSRPQSRKFHSDEQRAAFLA